MFSYYFYFATSATIFTSTVLSVDTVIRLTRNQGGEAVLALTELGHLSVVSRGRVFFDPYI